MKIGIVCYPSIGGSGILATELGHALAHRGHEVHFITYEIPFRLRLEEDNITFHEVEINQYDLFKYQDYALPLAVKIASVAQEYRLDILHVHYAVPHATSAFLAKQLMGTRRPVVITTLHGTDITLVGKDHSYFQIVKFSIEKSDSITAVSNNLRDQTIQYFNINKPIDVIYNFFTPHPQLIGSKPIRAKFVQDDEKLLCHASNFRPLKRIKDVIAIYAEVRKAVKSKLLFLGFGPEIEAARKMVADLKLQKDVIFLGKNRDIDPFIASSDLFLLPSEQESFGLAALQAMAYGVPVVASNAGGIPELIENGKSGFLASIGDIQTMRQKAIQLLTDQNLYRKMSRAAQERAKNNFSVEKILLQYEREYDRALT